jgi:hypothetical protein
MSNDIVEVFDAEPIPRRRAVGAVALRSGELVESHGTLRRIPRDVLNYTHLLLIHGEPHPISDAHAAEIGMFATLAPTGILSNGTDRTAAFVAILPRGKLAVINMDDLATVPQAFEAANRRQQYGAPF